MTACVRPAIEQQVFRDAARDVIDYGNRWGMEGPPEDTYSVATHPERFHPLHAIADALVSYMIDTCDVTVLEDPAVARDLLHERTDVLGAVRITPHGDCAAQLTVVTTSSPGVEVHAGELSDGSFPSCGCDACDDSLETVAELFQEFVLAVVEGRFWERVGPGYHPWVESGTKSPNGDSWGRSEKTDLPALRVCRAQEVLADVPNGWAAWSRLDQSS